MIGDPMDARAGANRIIRPSSIDPSTPTLLTCINCGRQIIIANGLAELATSEHDKGCLGPKITAIMSMLAGIVGGPTGTDQEISA